jgi:cytochrome c7-like protein
MRGRFRHAGHVLRVAALFFFGFVAFLIVRAILIPPDFGVYGFYRAGALDDAKARPIKFAGRAACEECHAGTYDPPDDDAKAVALAKEDPVKDNKHITLNCEACHGPLAVHADDPEKPVSKVGNDKLCLRCHLELKGRPSIQPQVIPGDHGDNDPCVSCHKPHRPKTDES